MAFLDDDCLPHADWLQHLITKLQGNDHLMVGGSVINRLQKNRYATASQLLLTYLYQIFNKEKDKATFFTSNNMVVAKKTFQNLCGC